MQNSRPPSPAEQSTPACSARKRSREMPPSAQTNLWPDGVSLRLPPTGSDSTAETSKILAVNADGGHVSPPGSNHCVSPGWLPCCVLAAPLTFQRSFAGCTKPSLPGFSLLTALSQSLPFVGFRRHLWRTWWEGRKGR